MPTRAQLSDSAKYGEGHTDLMIAALEGDVPALQALLAART